MSDNLEGFKMAWKALPTELRKEVREDIKRRCHLRTDFQFNDRKTGRVKISIYEASRIKGIFAKHGIDALSGEEIK